MTKDSDVSSPALVMPPELHCYRLVPDPPQMVPGRSEREWMDDTPERFAYRCTPLSIANASGWELLLPAGLAASWNGGPRASDITIMPRDDNAGLERLAVSAFGHGILTFRPGYLFRTSPGWAMRVSGAPNSHTDGIIALEGLVETDWTPATFTMNWRFTRPGLVQFEKNECFCFLTLVPHSVLDTVQPVLHDISDNPRLQASYESWRDKRVDFSTRLARREPEAVRQGWQRDYLHGYDAEDNFKPFYHLSKRRLLEPREDG